MADDITVDIGQLRDSGRQVQRLGEEVAGQQGRWEAGLGGSAAAWGADEEGVAFAGAYQEATNAAGEMLSELAEALDTIGANLKTMADNLASADEFSQERLLAIVHQLGKLR